MIATKLCNCDPVTKTCVVCGIADAFCGSSRVCIGPQQKESVVTPPPPTHGPGTELSKLLKRFGIEPTPTCACRAKQQEMDLWGPDECSKPERIDEVVAVMRAEAAARGLPFLDIAGRLLVRRAISNARRNA
jgi:hypothetical protein